MDPSEGIHICTIAPEEFKLKIFAMLQYLMWLLNQRGNTSSTGSAKDFALDLSSPDRLIGLGHG